MKTSIDHLRGEVSAYQAKLEKAEKIAARDSLTGLGSRLWVESQIEQCLQADLEFCVAIIDINKFKTVNDKHGHLVGDELLKQFAEEMLSVCHSTDIIGRWGGDEFMLALNNCGLKEATVQIDRLREWVCGDYTVEGISGVKKLRGDVSIGLAERQPQESMEELVDRADTLMYQQKAHRGPEKIQSCCRVSQHNRELFSSRKTALCAISSFAYERWICFSTTVVDSDNMKAR